VSPTHAGPATHSAAPPASVANVAVNRAKSKFQEGSKLFDEGRYADAIVAFKAGDALKPDPAFDFDIAACYGKLGDLSNQKVYLVRTLDTAPDESPYRARAAEALGEVEAQLEKQNANKSSTSAHPTPAPPPTPSRFTPANLVAGGGTLVLLGTGALFATLSSNADQALHSHPRSQSQADSDLSTARTDAWVADGFLAAGVIAAGVTTWLFFRTPNESNESNESTRPQPRVSLLLAPGGGFASVSIPWSGP
jgi:hypothetical protein